LGDHLIVLLNSLKVFVETLHQSLSVDSCFGAVEHYRWRDWLLHWYHSQYWTAAACFWAWVNFAKGELWEMCTAVTCGEQSRVHVKVYVTQMHGVQRDGWMSVIVYLLPLCAGFEECGT